MLGTIIRKEILSNLQSSKFFIVLGLSTVLICCSLLFMHRDFDAKSQDYQLIRPRPGNSEAVLPPNPLAILAKGLDDSMTRAFRVDSIGISVTAGQKTDNPIFLLFPTPDFIFVVKVVLSLAALLMGFDQISRERELGTLKLVLANAVPRGALLLGKWVGNYLCLTVPVLLLTCLGFVLVQLDPAVHVTGDQTLRFLCTLGLTGLYLALFLSLGILFSTLARRTATALVGLLLAWAMLVFLLPNLGTLLARQITPIPSVASMQEKASQTWTREILLFLEERSRGDMPSPMAEACAREHFMKILHEHDVQLEQYLNCLQRLSSRAQMLNRLSPVASFGYATTEICGTGLGEEMHLRRRLGEYARQVVPVLLDSKSDKPVVQAFEFQPRDLVTIFREGALFDALWLLLGNAILLVASIWAFARLEIQ